MAERQVRTLLDGGSFFEGPRWHEGRWWASDFFEQARSAANEAVLLTSTVDVPRAGLP